MHEAMVPAEHAREALALPFDRARFARDALESTVAYLGIAHAPPGAARTRRDPDGSIVLHTELRGRVSQVGPEGLVVESGGHAAVVRHFMPPAIDLGALLDTEVTIEMTERLRDGRCTVDAQIRDAGGSLVLWARDGELPEDRASHGLALRMRMAEIGRGLAIAHRSGLAVVRGPGLALVEGEPGTLLVLVLRTGDDDVALIALRR